MSPGWVVPAVTQPGFSNRGGTVADKYEADSIDGSANPTGEAEQQPAEVTYVADDVTNKPLADSDSESKTVAAPKKASARKQTRASGK